MTKNRLQSLSISELITVAEQQGIINCEDMEREDLIDSIIDAFEESRLERLEDDNWTIKSVYKKYDIFQDEEISLEKVAAMGQSCGGAQVLAVAHDPRIKTCMIFNSGMGEMAMSGASKESLANLHTPMLYINGGVADVAFNNANGDYGRIADDIPVVKISTLDGHHGTYYETHAGSFAVVARSWMDWQLKGNVASSALFMNDEYEKAFYPEWTFDRKNW